MPARAFVALAGFRAILCSARRHDLEHSLALRNDASALELVGGAFPSFDNMSVLAKTKAVRADAFHEMWPINCAGANDHKENHFENDPGALNGFRCVRGVGHKIESLNAPMWNNKEGFGVCCESECVHVQAGMNDHCRELALPAVCGSIIRHVNSFSSKGPFTRVLLRHMEPTSEEKKDGVLGTISVHLNEINTTFSENTDQLTAEGKKGLTEVATKLVTLMSFVSTAHPGAKVKGCAHASSPMCAKIQDVARPGRDCHGITTPDLQHVPKGRADAIEKLIATQVPGLTFGENHGHFRFENKGDFEGGLYAMVIFKIYAETASEPLCDFADLYKHKAGWGER